MIHYHGTPITPMDALHTLHGKHFCVSFAAPADVSRCHKIGQSVMLDNGAFSMWKANKRIKWSDFYIWVEEWLSFPTTWAVIPDIIDGDSDIQDELVDEWPFVGKGAPVWHMNETLERLRWLTDVYPRVCIGSTSVYSQVMSQEWQIRMDESWDYISKGRKFLPAVHMLRGMQCSGRRWPFASVDSTDIARNHHLKHNTPLRMAERWDSVQCPGHWPNSHNPKHRV